MIDMTDTTAAEAADRLEAALAALGFPVDTEAATNLTDTQRAGTASGILAATLMQYTVAAAITEDGTADMDVHRAMVQGLDIASGELRDDILYAYLGVLELWTMGEGIAQVVGPDAARSAVAHLEEAKGHLDGSITPHPFNNDDATYVGPAFLAGDERGAAGTPPDLMAEFTAPESDPVRRLSRSCMAMGLLPGITAAIDSDVEPNVGYGVSLLAGTLAARSTLEMVNAIRTVPDERRYLLAQLWVKGFTMGLVTTPDREVPDAIISGTMMRILNLIAAWHAGAGETPRARIVADLCMAALCAARSDGLAESSIDAQAEYIARHGVDHADSHREAVELAEAALTALRNVDTL